MSFFARLLALGLVSIALFACQGNQSKPDRKDSLSVTGDAAQSVESLLARAELADGLARIDLQLQAAQGLVKLGDWDQARSIINNMPAHANTDQLPIELQARLALVKSHLAAADGYYPLAYEYVNSPSLLAARSALPQNLAGEIAEQRAGLLYDMGFYAASVEERVLLQGQLADGDSPASRDNEQRLWQALMAIPLTELEQLISISTKRELEGWYRLAALSKDTQSNLREQLARLDRWILEWPDHPASLALPADLKMLKQILEDQPRQIAVLLPLSGPLSGAAKAIRDGFMAAYYEQQSQTADSPALRFYDTAHQDINALYDQAVADGERPDGRTDVPAVATPVDEGLGHADLGERVVDVNEELAVAVAGEVVVADPLGTGLELPTGEIAPTGHAGAAGRGARQRQYADEHPGGQYPARSVPLRHP